MNQIKQFLQQLIKGAVQEILADLKEEYLEEIVFDYYYVNYIFNNNKKTSAFIKIDSKGNFKYELDKQIRIANKKGPEDDINFKVESIFKL
jgi:hypothetical protein